jgi:hypothetical protein
MKKSIALVLVSLFSLLYTAQTHAFIRSGVDSWGSFANTQVHQALKKEWNSAPDTLEVFVIRIEFAYEETDNSLTTGRGTFDSDADTSSANYSLDPQGSRGSAAYWEKHFSFAHNYFQAVSGGRLAVEAEIFPRNSRAYQLDDFIIDYNRTQQREDEKTAEYNDARAQDYLRFVRDAVLKANAGEDSPFRDSLSGSENRHRVYMIIHAGASRLVDGGSMGTMGADTPGDFMDVFLGQDAFQYLDEEAPEDTAGIVLDEVGLDTLKEIMVMSETASQDGLNWGVNGSLVNQLARQIGLPITYDAIRGYSRLGYYDLMDFAGYNAQNGFLPVLPSAWLRAYMGWAEVREVRPGSEGKAQELLRFAGAANAGTFSAAGVEMLKVPLTAGEYLLIENRQRAWNGSEMAVEMDHETIDVEVDSLHLLFQDSVCNTDGGDCEVNRKKAEGVVLGVDSWDAGLPASGIAVWHVNEWYIEQYLRYGFVNAWAGDTLRDHQFGIALVEADGVLSIGKEFYDQLGQPAFDYGSGSDLLPHIRKHENEEGEIERDTVLEINAGGYASTSSLSGGKTHIRIRVPIPGDALKERNVSGFSGDSIINFRQSEIPVEIIWSDVTLSESLWPRRVAPGSRITALNYTQLSNEEQGLWLSGKSGWLQYMDARGGALLKDTSLVFDARYDSAQSLLVLPSTHDSAQAYSIAGIERMDGEVVQILSDRQQSWIVSTSGIALRSANDSSITDSAFYEVETSANVILQDSLLWVVQDSLLLRLSADLSGVKRYSFAMPENVKQQRLALCKESEEGSVSKLMLLQKYRTDEEEKLSLGYFTQSGEWQEVLANIYEEADDESILAGQFWQMICSDADRNGEADVFILGSLGNAFWVDVQNGELMQARTYERGSNAWPDSSAPAIGDLNEDGYPDYIFSGRNLLWAVDYSGVSLEGFPYQYEGMDIAWLGGAGAPPPGTIASAPLVLDADGDGALDVLSAVPGGLVFAVDASGKLLKKIGTSADYEEYEDAGALRTPVSAWPLAAGEFPYFDSLQSPFVELSAADVSGGSALELYALDANYMYGWTLPLSTKNSSQAQWLQLGGDGGQSFWFNTDRLTEPDDVADKAEIQEFFLYPNPLREPMGTLRLELGARADLTLQVYDLAGYPVLEVQKKDVPKGRSDWEGVDFSDLASDVYVLHLRAEFIINGKRIERKAWDRMAVVR